MIDDRPDGLAFHWELPGDPLLDRVVALLDDGLSAPRVAERLGLSRSAAYRLRDRALQLGRLTQHLAEEPTP